MQFFMQLLVGAYLYAFSNKTTYSFLGIKNIIIAEKLSFFAETKSSCFEKYVNGNSNQLGCKILFLRYEKETRAV